MLKPIIINGTDTGYRISETGKVFNPVGKQLKVRMSHGYMVVTIRLGDSSNTTRHLHRLLAEAFIPNPKHKRQVRFKDQDPFNLSLDNLVWGTGIQTYKLHHGRKYSKDQLQRVCSMLEKGAKIRTVSGLTGITFGTVKAIYERTLFTDVSKNYQFPVQTVTTIE